MKDHARQQKADALGTAVDRARQPARLAGEVKVQVETQQVVKDVTRNASNRRLGNFGKDGIAHLLEDGRADAGEPIAHDGSTSRGPDGAADGQEVNVHAVDNGLEEEGHLHVEHLGSHQQAQSQRHAHLGPDVVLRRSAKGDVAGRGGWGLLWATGSATFRG